MNRRVVTVLFIAGIAGIAVPACCAQDAATPASAQSLPAIELYFSPHGGCTQPSRSDTPCLTTAWAAGAR